MLSVTRDLVMPTAITGSYPRPLWFDASLNGLQHLADAFPDLLAAELAERLADLPDEHNQLIRLFDGTRTGMDAIDTVGLPDLAALELIAKLYLRPNHQHRKSIQA